MLPLDNAYKRGFPDTSGNMTPNCFFLDNEIETILVHISIYKNGIRKQIPREDEKRGPRRNARLPKKHLFHSRPKALRATFKRYKMSKSLTLETLVSL